MATCPLPVSSAIRTTAVSSVWVRESWDGLADDADDGLRPLERPGDQLHPPAASQGERRAGREGREQLELLHSRPTVLEIELERGDGRLAEGKRCGPEAGAAVGSTRDAVARAVEEGQGLLHRLAGRRARTRAVRGQEGRRRIALDSPEGSRAGAGRLRRQPNDMLGRRRLVGPGRKSLAEELERGKADVGTAVAGERLPLEPNRD